MIYPQIRQVVLIGAGNVATHLALHLKNQRFQLAQIWSRTETSAQRLAHQTGAPYCTDLKGLSGSADLYLLALPDDVLPQVLPQLKLDSDRFLVHTSGSTPLAALTPFSWRTGVFYPVHAFTSDNPVDFGKIPFCIEAGQPDDLGLLRDLAACFSEKIFEVESEKRRIVHLAAIFASNFTNVLYRISDDLLKQVDLPFDLVKPIILITAEKVQTQDPHRIQTGPAQRNDLVTVKQHLEWLSSNKKYRELYDLFTRYILEENDHTLK